MTINMIIIDIVKVRKGEEGKVRKLENMTAGL